jgi:hypothetical protein
MHIIKYIIFNSIMNKILYDITTYFKLSIYTFVLLLSLYNIFIEATKFYTIVFVLIIPSLHITYNYNKLFKEPYTIKVYLFKTIELLHIVYIIYYLYYNINNNIFMVLNKWNQLIVPFYGLLYGNIIVIYLLLEDM